MGRLPFVALAALFGFAVSAQEPVDSGSVVELREVVVKAANIIRKNDGFVLFPEADDMARSNDAVELIGNMNLPGVFLDNKTGSLSSTKKGAIAYRINGAPATEADFRAINPANIRKIEYITAPGLRYGDAGVVLNVFTARPDVGLSGNVSGRQGLNQGKGVYRASLKANYRKSEFTVYGHYEYGRFSDSRLTDVSSYQFADGSVLSRVNKSDPYVQKEDYLQASAAYSYMDDRNLFVAKLLLSGLQVPETTVYSTIQESVGDSKTTELERQTLRSKDLNPQVNMYYQHEFASKGLLIFDAVLNDMTVHNDNEKFYSSGDSSGSSILTYGFGKKYSTISQLQYIQPIRKGKLSVGVKHTWNKSRNVYSGTMFSESKQTRHAFNVFAEWSGSIRRFNYTVGLQGHHVAYNQNEEMVREWNLQPQIQLSYNATRNLSFSVSGNSTMSGSVLGQSSSIVYQNNKFQYMAGNTELKPEKTYNVSFSSFLFFGSYFGDFDVSYSRKNSPLMQDIFRDGERFFTTTVNGNRADMVNVSYGSRIRLLNGKLNISPRLGYSYGNWECNSYVNRIHTWWFKGGVSYSLQKFNFSLDYYKNADALVYGFGKRKTQQSLLFGVAYRVKSLRFGIDLSQPLNEYLYTLKTASAYATGSKYFYQRGNKPMILIQVSWNFSRNNKNSHREKRINNQDSDNGML